MKTKTRLMNIMVEPELFEAFKEWCEEHRTTMSAVLRECMEDCTSWDRRIRATKDC